PRRSGRRTGRQDVRDESGARPTPDRGSGRACGLEYVGHHVNHAIVRCGADARAIRKPPAATRGAAGPAMVLTRFIGRRWSIPPSRLHREPAAPTAGEAAASYPAGRSGLGGLFFRRTIHGDGVMRRLTRTTASLITLFLAAAAPAVGQIVQERVDLAVFERIRDEGLNRSQIEELAGYLTDVIGPRLTNSPAMRRANEWTAQKFREWGLSNVVIEPWGEFGRGWERVSYSGRILTPFVQPLNAQPLAWTGSTRGTVKGPAVIVEAETVEDLEKYRGKLRNAFVLMQPPTGLGAEFERAPLRTPLEELVPDPFGRRSREQARQAAQPTPEEMQRRMQEMRQAAERRAALNNAARELFQAERVAAILQPSARNYGIIRAGGGAGRDPNSPIPLPELVVAQEQYGQIYRNVKRGIPVELEVNVQNRFFSDDLRAYNTLA